MAEPKKPARNNLSYEIERRTEHLVRPDFRITEFTLAPSQQIPWHCHTNVRDTVYVVAGEIRLFLREPKEEARLAPGDSYVIAARRPHLVVNRAATSATFFLLQGMGEYDFVRLV